MPHIEELRRQRAGINEQVQALATIDASGGTLTAEQLTEFANLQQQFTDISAKIERLEAAERAAALVAKPVKATQQGPAVIVKAEPKQYTGAGMTRMVMSIAAAKGDLRDAAVFAAEELNDQSVSMAISTAAGSGGALIPENMQNEVIELLSDRTIVRKLGARSIPLPNGNLSLPRSAGGATASYTGEGKDAKSSESKFDDVKLNAKTMIALVPMSNQLIGRAGFNVEQLVLQDILTAISVREDKAFMRDDGDVLTTGSDVRLKDAFMEPQEGACRRINSLGVCEFNMKGETRRRRGFIAQQAEKVDDLYTFLGIEQEIDGEKFRVMNVDYTAIIADLVTVVQDLIRRVDALES